MPEDRAADVERLWKHVVKGPDPDDCWIWTGSVGDDGYGRFWTAGDGIQQRTMRPQRFLYRHLTGIDLPPSTMLLHRCDVALCVHVDVDPAVSHLRIGGAAENQRDAARAGRQRNRFTIEKYASLPRADRVARSRRLRDTVRDHGWDPQLIARALSDAGTEHPTLW
ncbi:hypothetical protein KZC56_17345 [Microbacterium sp. SSW1-47]|uniref:hypothetical protein n=1 Tax=Microbacterium sufflavum TaxID=2851649 RepID=UPI001FFC4DD9|nr:hypothetical protein [Microbacterium sufflavum]MCK2028065.1 hypothetical protein [Microbacterium sufflavum]